MPVNERMRVQNNLILDSLEDAAAYPAPSQWNEDEVDDIDYLYREYAILTREHDADRVQHAVAQILREEGYGDALEGDTRRERVSAGLVRLMIPHTPVLVPAVLDKLDKQLGAGAAKPEHIFYVCPLTCPFPEPFPPPPGSSPSPPPAGLTEDFTRAKRVTGREGEGVSIVVVDTGLIENPAAGHPWLDGVRGAREEDTYVKFEGENVIASYAGHGTFVAGVARCVAPKATVHVEKAFVKAGADYETSLLHTLEHALGLNPDVFVWPFTTSTRGDLPPITFDDLFERRIRYQKGLVMLAAAGNDHAQRLMWPAAFPQVIAVGALAVNGRERAAFSNYGKWVDVYAPGQNLINAFPVGTYVYHEPPRVGDRAQFEGLAIWGGTSFAVPIVAGLIADQMSATGENARQAADSLLQFALGQAIPGVGAVLYPGG